VVIAFSYAGFSARSFPGEKESSVEGFRLELRVLPKEIRLGLLWPSAVIPESIPLIHGVDRSGSKSSMVFLIKSSRLGLTRCERISPLGSCLLSRNC